MGKKTEAQAAEPNEQNSLRPGFTRSGKSLLELDTTGYDGSSMTDAQVDAHLAKIHKSHQERLARELDQQVEGITQAGSDDRLSQLDTTGYDGSKQSAEAIAASLARINAMPLTPAMLAGRGGIKVDDAE